MLGLRGAPGRPTRSQEGAQIHDRARPSSARSRARAFREAGANGATYLSDHSLLRRLCGVGAREQRRARPAAAARGVCAAVGTPSPCVPVERCWLSSRAARRATNRLAPRRGPRRHGRRGGGGGHQRRRVRGRARQRAPPRAHAGAPLVGGDGRAGVPGAGRVQRRDGVQQPCGPPAAADDARRARPARVGRRRQHGRDRARSRRAGGRRHPVALPAARGRPRLRGGRARRRRRLQGRERTLCRQRRNRPPAGPLGRKRGKRPPPPPPPPPPSQARAVKALLAHRLPPADAAAAKGEWYQIVEGQHALWDGVSEPYKHMIRAFLIHFHVQILSHSTEQFNFANGSIGAAAARGGRGGVGGGACWPAAAGAAVVAGQAACLRAQYPGAAGPNLGILPSRAPSLPRTSRKLLLRRRAHLFPLAGVCNLPVQPRRAHPRGLRCERSGRRAPNRPPQLGSPLVALPASGHSKWCTHSLGMHARSHMRTQP
jgi:hypothetical protein